MTEVIRGYNSDVHYHPGLTDEVLAQWARLGDHLGLDINISSPHGYSNRLEDGAYSRFHVQCWSVFQFNGYETSRTILGYPMFSPRTELFRESGSDLVIKDPDGVAIAEVGGFSVYILFDLYHLEDYSLEITTYIVDKLLEYSAEKIINTRFAPMVQSSMEAFAERRDAWIESDRVNLKQENRLSNSSSAEDYTATMRIEQRDILNVDQDGFRMLTKPLISAHLYNNRRAKLGPYIIRVGREPNVGRTYVTITNTDGFPAHYYGSGVGGTCFGDAHWGIHNLGEAGEIALCFSRVIQFITNSIKGRSVGSDFEYILDDTEPDQLDEVYANWGEDEEYDDDDHESYDDDEETESDDDESEDDSDTEESEDESDDFDF